MTYPTHQADMKLIKAASMDPDVSVIMIIIINSIYTHSNRFAAMSYYFANNNITTMHLPLIVPFCICNLCTI